MLLKPPWTEKLFPKLGWTNSADLEERDSLTTESVTNSSLNSNLGDQKTTPQSVLSRRFSDKRRRNKFSRILISELPMMTKTRMTDRLWKPPSLRKSCLPLTTMLTIRNQSHLCTTTEDQDIEEFKFAVHSTSGKSATTWTSIHSQTNGSRPSTWSQVKSTFTNTLSTTKLG